MSDATATAAAFECCGVRIDAHNLDSATGAILANRGSMAVHLCNAYTLSLAVKDRGFAAALNSADLNLPDGMPLVWIGRRLGHTDMTTRVYGPDLMARVFDLGRQHGTRHYLYGSTPDVVRRLTERLSQRFPGAKIVGSESPPFRQLSPLEAESMVTRVRTTRPDVVWVGLGTPKQDDYVERFAPLLDAAVVGVGAAFDFHAGTLPQAPAWMQDRGLEWAYRLAKEPKRLWRRYLIGNATFARAALPTIISGASKSS